MLLYVLLVAGVFVSGALGLEAREQLYRDLFVKYNKVPRPVRNHTDKVTIKFGIAISQLIDVDEKNQVLTTSVWLRQEWFDYKLNWNPEDYGNLTYIRVPSTEIWVPDVVLYNNADGSFDVAAKTRAQVFHDGRVRWIPPALYKSYCYIDVRFFPFDQQNCSMKFGTWTYDFTLVDMTLWENAMDRANFRESGEWIVIDAPVYRHVEDYACCPPYVDVTGYLVIQRLPLFFTVNLIVPCVLFSFISLFVFYLPSNCGEKITLSISVLLSLSVFLLVIFNTIPSTSLAVPLIGKYLLFTVTMVATSITATVFVSNIYHRSGSTHDMSEWVRVVFLRWLPGILCMRRPGDEASIEKDLHMSLPDLEETKLATALQYVKMRRMRARRQTGEDQEEYQKCPVRTIEAPEEARPALEGLEYVTSFLKRQDKCDALEEDWNYIAMIIDRIFLWVFSVVCLLGTGCIFLEPFVTDNKPTPAADGKFEVTSYTRAQVFYDGTVRWVPPAIYKSYCYIDVRFFPFDQQNCSMKFGTWTYDYTLVDMIPWGDRKVNRDDFRETGEWVIIDAPVYRHVENYECCPPYVDVTAYLVIQRLPLFFTINLIVPCVLFSFISLFVFYLPSRGQKITLSISVLLSISVFLLVIFNTIPSTSFAIPLIGKYLLFTATLVTLSIVATVFVLNVYHRSGSTHQMPPWVRMIFLQKLPTMLCMRRPRSKGKDSDMHGSQMELEENKIATAIKYVKLRRLRMAGRRAEEKEEDYAGYNTKTVEAPEEARPALEGLEYVASFLKRQDKCDALEEDWKYVAMIIDRIFLWMFVSACLVGTCSIFIEPWMQDDIHGTDD